MIILIIFCVFLSWSAYSYISSLGETMQASCGKRYMKWKSSLEPYWNHRPPMDCDGTYGLSWPSHGHYWHQQVLRDLTPVQTWYWNPGNRRKLCYSPHYAASLHNIQNKIRNWKEFQRLTWHNNMDRIPYGMTWVNSSSYTSQVMLSRGCIASPWNCGEGTIAWYGYPISFRK